MIALMIAFSTLPKTQLNVIFWPHVICVIIIAGFQLNLLNAFRSIHSYFHFRQTFAVSIVFFLWSSPFTIIHSIVPILDCIWTVFRFSLLTFCKHFNEIARIHNDFQMTANIANANNTFANAIRMVAFLISELKSDRWKHNECKPKPRQNEMRISSWFC